jgi:hypothetical protein
VWGPFGLQIGRIRRDFKEDLGGSRAEGDGALRGFCNHARTIVQPASSLVPKISFLFIFYFCFYFFKKIILISDFVSHASYPFRDDGGDIGDGETSQ